MMTSDDVQRWVDLLDERGIRFWVDGGWGVDALLGSPSREHDDLDLVIEAHRESELLALLRELEYSEVPTPFSTAVHSVWRDEHGSEVDLHVITLDAQGDGRFGPSDVYPADGLAGHGVIKGRAVRCITAEMQLEFHLGYDHDADDRADVLALCSRFDLPVPAQYRG